MKKLSPLLFVIAVAFCFVGCQNTSDLALNSEAGTFRSDIFLAKASATTLPGAIVSGMTIILTQDVSTDETIQIPDGYTLDGAGYTITAVDPISGHFLGAIVENAGSTAHVRNLTVTAAGLANVCDGGANRLRGIMFEGASGSIRNCRVLAINQGASGCQEGNAIEIRNAPFNGTHPNTQTVEINNNYLDNYQKTGIVANGDINVSIHNNRVGSSATQANLAANSIQLGFGATGSVRTNVVDGNQWLGASNFAATAVLIFLADNVNVSLNQIRGNSDVGIFVVSANAGNYNNNRVFDNGPDGPHGDFGIVDFGTGNVFTNNKVKGFDTPNLGASGGTNKIIPGRFRF